MKSAEQSETIASTINLMMDTMITDNKRIRRTHSAAFKTQVVAECEVAGASVARVAMAHGINANVVHGWRRWARERSQRPALETAFVPLAMEPVVPTERHVAIELRRGATSMTLNWPLSASAELASWMRELLR